MLEIFGKNKLKWPIMLSAYIASCVMLFYMPV